jgi:hypothetical protein
MTQRWRQAGFPTPVIALALFCLLLGAPWPVTAASSEPLSAEGLISGVEDNTSSAPSSSDTSIKAVPLAPPAKEIIAKKLPADAAPAAVDAKKAPQPPATYRVYPTPVVSEQEGIRDSGLGTRDGTPFLSSQAPNPESRIPAVAGIGNQYFPILPLNAISNTSPQFLPLVGNRDLATDHDAVTRAIIFIHDLSRNAGEGVSMLTTLAGADGGTTLILAPQFLLGIDVARFAAHLPEEGRVIARWPLGAGGWQMGGDSVSQPPQKGISSFTALDLLLLYLADKQTFPQLQQVVIAGHGMGADFVQRYAAAGQAPDILTAQGLPVRFLVANASSYLYFTALRPGTVGPNFVPPNTSQCAGVNTYPYGLGDLVPYARRSGGNAIRLRYPERRVMYLLGDKITGDPFLDMSCAAMIQGKDRFTRGRNYERYLVMSFGDDARATQSFAYVPNGGYDPVALFGSYCGLAMLFGDGVCSGKPAVLEEAPLRY